MVEIILLSCPPLDPLALFHSRDLKNTPQVSPVNLSMYHVPKKYVKEEYWQGLRSSECEVGTIYPQVLECFASATLALLICWVI